MIQGPVMNYPGANKPLTVENATDIINRLHSLYSDFPYNIDNTMLDGIAEMSKNFLWEDNSDRLYITPRSKLEIFLNTVHIILGGQNDWTECGRITEEALRQLSDEGKAEQISKYEWEERLLVDELFEELINGTPAKPAQRISKEKWRILPPHQQIFGEGEGWVYLYYFDKGKAEAQDQGSKVWPCKIGFTENEPEKRIQQQMEENSDIPIIALLLQTNKPKVLERSIHGILTLRGSHLKHPQGREWFLTEPDEVASIYKFITDWKHQITL